MKVSSVSRVQILLELQDKGLAKAEIVRHSAPLTASEVLKSLPLQQIAHNFQNKFIYIETELNIGREKQRTQFKKGQMAYMTFHGSICIFINDTISTPMNPLGTIVSNLELLKGITTGDILTVRREL
ncbi:MAG TPA: cyclophilin-like fold protein [Nitrososphaeraceae archaeon]